MKTIFPPRDANTSGKPAAKSRGELPGAANHFMKTTIAVIGAALLCGCSTIQPTPGTQPATTNQVVDVVRKVTVDVVNSGALVIVAQMGTTAALALSKDVRAEGAALYAWSTAVGDFLLAHGSVPSTDQIKALALLLDVNISNDASAQIVQMVVDQAQVIVNGLGGDVATVRKGIGQVAEGVSKATIQCKLVTP